MCPRQLIPALCLVLVIFISPAQSRSNRQKRDAFQQQQQQTADACLPLPAPQNGRVNCAENSFGFACTATCLSGYQFENHQQSVERSCDTFDGTWEGNKMTFPKCLPICSPGCLNGGTCKTPNFCACSSDFRGQLCQFPTSLCDQPDPPVFGRVYCKVDMTSTRCNATCYDGYRFETAPKPLYTCNIDGTWDSDPTTLPNCVPEVNVITVAHPTGMPQTTVMASLVHPDAKAEGVCSTWSQSHYKSFDNKVYTFVGGCEYILAKDCSFSHSFSINVINDRHCTSSPCRRSIDISIGGTSTISLRSTSSSASVTWNGIPVHIPSVKNGIIFEKIGEYIAVRYGNKFSLKWDSQEWISLSVSQDMKGDMCGLCGQFNGNSTDDFLTPKGKVVTSAVSFATSWKVNKLGESICPDTSSSCTSSKVSSVIQRSCDEIMRSEFSPCHKTVDPTPYRDACRVDCCTYPGSAECKCNSFSAYSRACLREKVELSWRSPHRCPVTCTDGKVYKECGSSCPQTCTSTTKTCTDETCVDGCFCPSGMVLNGTSCIQTSQCPCTYQGRVYAVGTSVNKDQCNSCTCQAGKWQCTKNQCSAMCYVTGDPHYKTFDGKRFNFMGTCSYYLMWHPDFNVTVDNYACGHADATCTKSVQLTLDGVTIKLNQGHQLLVNGLEVKTLPYNYKGIKIYMASSLFMKVELGNGLTVLWDGSTRVYLTAPKTLYGQTKGMCGTFDGNQNTDFITKEGDIEPNVNLFGNKWRTDPTCAEMPEKIAINPCDLNTQRKSQAMDKCKALRGHLFKDCHSVESVDIYYEDCLYDICSCERNIKQCLCPNIGAYADACAAKGVYVDWRGNVTECMLSCPGGQVHQVCGDSCQRSCRNIAEDPHCQAECVEGCNCPRGQSLDHDGECVPKMSCPCIFDDREYHAGFATMKGKEFCVCEEARWKCSPTRNEIPIGHPIQPLCPTFMEYSDCISDCPLSCENSDSSCATSKCVAGCACTAGYVLDGEICVLKAECPCHHGGQKYYEGDEIKLDCNTCTCSSRKWDCSTHECPATCSAYGDSHYQTFDGKHYEFQGNCDYILATSTDDNPVPFMITTENVPCGTQGVTCTKAVDFSIGQPGTLDFYKVELIRGKPVKVEPGSPFTVREVGMFIQVKYDKGISLLWDKGTRIYIQIDIQHKDKVQGLCGNFNNNQNDDFVSPQEGPPVILATDFGDSWKVREYCAASQEIADTCTLNSHRKPWALQRCGIIQSDLFKPCHNDVPYHPFYERCVYDACACDQGGDCECLCTAVAAYAHECALQGVPISWRSQETCPIQCEDCTTYTSCVNQCPHKTCDNFGFYDKLLKSCTEDMCVEGCNVEECPSGQVYDRTKAPMRCIPQLFCNNTVCRVNGQNYREGERIHDSTICRNDCEICFCSNGQIRRTGMCQSSTVTHTHEVTPVNTAHLKVTSTTASSVATSSTAQTAKTTASRSTEATTVTETTPTTATSPSVYSTKKPFCQKTGWTHWMSSQSPTPLNQGDLENHTNLRHVYSYCDYHQITSVQCRKVHSTMMAAYTGQKVSCTVEHGLKCLHSDQSGQTCDDYELRFQCDCGAIVPTTVTFGPSSFTPDTPTPGPRVSSPPVVTKGPTPGVTLTPGQYTTTSTTAGQSTATSTTLGQTTVTSSPSPGTPGTPTRGPRVSSPPVVTKGPTPRVTPTPGQHTDTSTTAGQSTATSTPPGQTTVTSSPPSGTPGTPTPGPRVSSPPVVTKGPTPGVTLTPGTDTSTTAGQSTATSTTPGQTTVTSSPSPGKPGSPTPGPRVSSPPVVTKGPTPGVTLTPGRYIVTSTTAGQSTASPTPGVSVTPGLRTTTASPTPINTNIPTSDHTTHKINSPPFKTHSTHSTHSPPGSTFSTNTSLNTGCRTNWTIWIDASQPNDLGEMETLAILRKKQPFCHSEYIRVIECRTVDRHLPFDQSGDARVTCDIHKGLVCYNKDQPTGKRCQNYEVRVYCYCAGVRYCKKMLTEEFSVTNEQFTASSTLDNNPSYGPARAKINSVSDVHGFGGWKPELSDSKPWIQVDFGQELFMAGVVVQGSADAAEWVTSFQVAISDKYCQNFKFVTDVVGLHKPKLFTGPVSQNTNVTSLFMLNYEGRCIRILPLTHHGAASLRFDVLGCNQVGTTTEALSTPPLIPFTTNPIVSTESRSSSVSWTTKLLTTLGVGSSTNETPNTPTGVHPVSGETITPPIGSTASPTPGYSYSTSPTPGYSSSTSPSPGYSSSTPRQPTPYVCTHGWTTWMNIDKPTVDMGHETEGVGDYELIKELRYKNSFCARPTTIKCRAAGTKMPSHLSGDVVVCDLPEGLICVNADQATGMCQDYEISLMCECAETSTVVSKPTTQGSSQTTMKSSTTESTDTSSKGSETTTESTGTSSKTSGTTTKSTLTSFKVSGATTESTGSSTKVVETTTEATGRSSKVSMPNTESTGTSNKASVTTPEPSVTTPEPSVTTPEPSGPTTQTSEQTSKSTGPTSPSARTTSPHISTPQQPTPVCGWSMYMNNPISITSGGDIESFGKLRLKYSFCERPSDIECRVAGSGVLYSQAGQRAVTCDVNAGLVCLDNLQPQGTNCLDYEVRVFCTDGCSTDWGTSSVKYSTTTDKTSSSATPTLTPSVKTVTPTIGDRVSTLSPGTNTYSSPTMSPTGSTETPTPRPPFNTKTPTKGLVRSTQSFSCIPGWTGWLNMNKPTSDAGDIEDIHSLPGYPASCMKVLDVQCKAAVSDKDYHLTGQMVTCDLNGVTCDNDDKQICLDYKVRYFCQCGSTAQSTTESTRTSGSGSSVSTIASTSSHVCNHGWTELFNVDRPKDTDGGDFETLDRLTNQHFCEHSQITAIDCLQTGTEKTPNDLGQVVVCDVKTGLSCVDSQQTSGSCYDYSVRFYCDCGQTSTEGSSLRTTPVTKSSSESTQGSSTPTGLVTKTDITDTTVTTKGSSPQTSHVTKGSSAFTGSTPTGPVTLCDIPMGLTSSHIITNDQFQASSVLSYQFEAEQGRLDSVAKGNLGAAWVPRKSDKKQWLQVDFLTSHKITGVVTQGNPDSPQWVTSYIVSTSQDGKIFTDYKENGVVRVFNGNSEGTYYSKNFFTSEIDARYVRINPVSWAGGIALRFEVLSCAGIQWTVTVAMSSTTHTASSSSSTGQSTQSTPGLCNQPMGIDNAHLVPDSFLTASSALGQNSIASSGRLFNTFGAWSPKISDKNQWIQVKFNNIETISGILIQGSPLEDKWVTKLTVSTSQDGIVFTPYKALHSSSVKTFDASTGGQSPVKIVFDRDISARFVRIMPVEWSSAGIAMRFSLLGCYSAVSTSHTTRPTQSTIIVTTPVVSSTTTLSPDGGDNITPTPGPSVSSHSPTPWPTTGHTLSPVCTDKMGVEDYKIVTNRQLTSSSQLDIKHSAPNGRLTNTGGSQTSWVPSTTDKKPWIQVDFQKSMTISGIVTQGEITSANWLKTFEIEYSVDGKTFIPYSEVAGDQRAKVFTGNSDQSQLVTNLFNRNIEAQYVRVKALTHNGRVSLRFNILGCSSEIPPTPVSGGMSTPTPSPSVSGETPTPTPNTQSTKAPVCTDKMGVEDYQIVTNRQLTSSSQLDIKHSAPNGRLTNTGGSQTSWVPSTTDKKPWIQVDFQKSMTISGIVTQGEITSANWLKTFKIEYSVDDKTFIPYSEVAGDQRAKVFTGNSDQSQLVTNLFNRNIEAQYVRVTALTYNGRVSLRFNILGCSSPTTPSPVSTPTSSPSVSNETPTPSPSTGKTSSPVCDIPMGLTSSHIITNDQFQASSVLSYQFEARQGRLDSVAKGNLGAAWVPRKSDKKQWLQVDFLTSHKITGVVTQGNPDSPQWVTSYIVSTSQDGKIFTDYKENGVVRVFNGNSEGTYYSKNFFTSEIDARYVRINPVSWAGGIALRFEVLSCAGIQWTVTVAMSSTTHTASSSSSTGQSTQSTPGLCNQPMGIDNAHLVPDSFLTASSALGQNSIASSGRLFNTFGAWSPKISDKNQWIQVKFNNIETISGILIQGSPLEDKWVTKLTVSTSQDGIVFTPYKALHSSSVKTFDASTGGQSPVKIVFDRDISARFVRIMPVEWSLAGIAMRFSLLGCYSAVSTSHTTRPTQSTIIVTTPVVSSTTTLSPDGGDNITPTPGPSVSSHSPTPWPTTGHTLSPVCTDKMGVEDYKIVTNRQLTSSSQLDIKHSAPNGRLTNTDGSQTSWVPSTTDKKPWIQVDFQKSMTISGIVTQGEITSANWLKTFEIEYSVDGKTFIPYSEVAGDQRAKVFTGNSDQSQLVTNLFNRNIEAQYVRVTALTYNGRVSLRFNILGCSSEIPPTPVSGGMSTPTPSPSVSGETPTPTPNSQSTKAPVCTDKMGVEDYKIVTNRQLTSSSQLDIKHSAPNGRLTNTGGSQTSWVPSTTDKKPWIQVDFQKSMTISGIVTQGEITSANWLKTFEIEYSVDGKTFIPYSEVAGDQRAKVFTGNSDQSQLVTNLFNRNIEAQYVRVTALTYNGRVSLRFNILGCSSEIPPTPVSGGMSTPTPSPSVSGETPTPTPNTQSTKAPVCTDKMGVEDYQIVTNRQLTSSSQLDIKHSAPNGRLTNTGGSQTSWVPSTTDKKPWIQVDFQKSMTISGIVTQGEITSANWLKTFKIEYSVDDKTFIPYSEVAGDQRAKVFTGNSDQSQLVTNLFNRNIEAQYVRVTALTYNGRVSLRFNILGCSSPTTPSPVSTPTPSPSVSNETPTPSPSTGKTSSPVCLLPMGIESSTVVQPRQLTASSYFDIHHGPDRARLFLDNEGKFSGGWQSKTSDKNQWIQVDFLSPYEITAIATQGMKGSSLWVTSYTVLYSMDGLSFTPITEVGSTVAKVFTGNTDNQSSVQNVFNKISTRYVRIIPVSWHSGIGLRFNLYGCSTPSTAPVESAGSTSPGVSFSGPTPSTSCMYWTPWINQTIPVDMGEFESVVTMRSVIPVCSNEKITAMECRTADAQHIPSDKTGQTVKCDLATKTFTCLNVQQKANSKCQDYEIRVFCNECSSTSTPALTSPSTSTPALTSPSTSTPSTIPTTASLISTHAGKSTTNGNVFSSTSSISTSTERVTPSTGGVTKVTGQETTPPSTTGPVTSPSAIPSVPQTKHNGNCSWSSWINMDKPDTGKGDFEFMSEPEKAAFCPTGNLTRIECMTSQGRIPSYSSGEISECNVETGYSCSNDDNLPVPCSDFMVRYFCECAPGVGSSTSPVSASSSPRTTFSKTTGHASPSTTPATTVPSTTGSVPTGNCSWSSWINMDKPDTGKGDFEFMSEPEKAAFCPTGNLTGIECMTSQGQIPSYSSGEISECNVETGYSCSNDDNFPVPCSDFMVRYFCECEPHSTPSAQPPTSTPPKTYITCGWSDWLNTDNPKSGTGDLETINNIKSTFGLCRNIADIECRVAGSHTAVSAAGQSRVSCDVNNGLRCYNDEQLSHKCHDYEVRVLCWSEMCGTTPNLPTTSQVSQTTPICPPGHQWQTCAYKCGDLCHSNLVEHITKGLCEASNPEHCVPSCDYANCATGQKLSSSQKCLTPDLCSCKKPDGSVAMAGEQWENLLEECSRCTCHKNRIECTSDASCSRSKATPPATTTATVTSTSNYPCDWTDWINIDRPGGVNGGDIESLSAIRKTHELCEHPVSIACREVRTGEKADETGQVLTCHLDQGLICHDSENTGQCNDYEIRFYCPCEGTPTQTISTPTKETTSSLSTPSTQTHRPACGWTLWMSENTPNIDGEVEYISQMMASNTMCAVEDVTAVECRSVGSIHSQQPGVLCDVKHNGLICDNKLEKPDTCLDYEIRVFCEPKGATCPSTVLPPTGTTKTGTTQPPTGTTKTGTTQPPTGTTQTDRPTTQPSTGTTRTITPSPPTGNCTYGMGNMKFTIKSTSVRDAQFSPKNALVNHMSAWMPATDNVNEYIEIDFGIPRLLTGVTTQGRPGVPNFVTSYTVEYSYDGTHWNTYSEQPGKDQVFLGNSDSNTAATNWFMKPIRAQFIRLHPQTWQNKIALRFDIHGCFTLTETTIPMKMPTTSARMSTSTPVATTTTTPSKPTPTVGQNCINWGAWLNNHHPMPGNTGDMETIEGLGGSVPCTQPMEIECRTASPDKTDYTKTGQKVQCNLWSGMTCNNADNSPLCFDYEVRVGCLKTSPECISTRVSTTTLSFKSTSQSTGYTIPPPTTVPCYPGLNTTSCPVTGCSSGLYCDGMNCVMKKDCPCSIDGKVIRPGDFTTDKSCGTCTCFNGDAKCIPQHCPDCPQGSSKKVDSVTCACICESCVSNEFRCNTGQCLPINLRCDGVIDCDIDELNCKATTPTTTMTASREVSTVTPPTEITHSGGTTKVTDLVSSTILVTVTVPSSRPTTPSPCEFVVCQPLTRPSLKPGEQAVVVKTADGCCDTYKVMCNKDICTHLDCQFPMNTGQIPTGECCPHCSCPSVCPTPTPPDCNKGSLVTAVLSGCNCTTSACVPQPTTAEQITPTPGPRLSTQSTPTRRPTPGSTPTPTPAPCVRLLQGGKSTTYQPGEAWTEGLCRTCKCLNELDSSSGVSCSEQQCPKCRQAERAVAVPGKCCPECQPPNGCVIQGVLYKAGQTIPSTAAQDTCYTKSCEKSTSSKTFMVLKSKLSCPVDLPICKQGQSVMDPSGCCPQCINTTTPNSVCATCSPQLVFGNLTKSIGFFKVTDKGAECVNSSPIPDLTQCFGYCGSASKYRDLMSGLENVCQCCQSQKSTTRALILTCTDGRTLQKTYEVPTSCGCAACKSAP